jgi:hypothetical protein
VILPDLRSDLVVGLWVEFSWFVFLLFSLFFGFFEENLKKETKKQQTK